MVAGRVDLGNAEMRGPAPPTSPSHHFLLQKLLQLSRKGYNRSSNVFSPPTRRSARTHSASHPVSHPIFSAIASAPALYAARLCLHAADSIAVVHNSRTM